ncbi:hypothetical protein TNCV_1447081 [Trichonephila clavipes]|nr:hypothetical protein TNCV_1447081 [Trichonephila clavipes]
MQIIKNKRTEIGEDSSPHIQHVVPFEVPVHVKDVVEGSNSLIKHVPHMLCRIQARSILEPSTISHKRAILHHRNHAVALEVTGTWRSPNESLM